MRQDLRDTALYKEVEAFFQAVRQPGARQISDAMEVNASPHGQSAIFTGTVVDQLLGTPPTCIGQIDLATGATRVLTSGPYNDRFARYSPDGTRVAFLSDRRKVGDFQLYLLDLASGHIQITPNVEGWVEHLHWSPDGKRLLLTVAGHGADVAGAHGAIASKQPVVDVPTWMPEVDTGDESYRWRRAWAYELATNSVHPVSGREINVWEAAWCGNLELAAVTSPAPGEGEWYVAELRVLPLDGGAGRVVFKPQHQLGVLACSADGRWIAIVEAICSDRCIVAGDLLLIDTVSGEVRRADTRGMDVTYTEWRSDRHVLLAGHRRFQTVLGIYDVLSGKFTETWRSETITTGGRYVAVSGIGSAGDCVLVGENFVLAPEFAVVRGGHYRTVKSLDLGYGKQAEAIESVEQMTWIGHDGLDIEGWLLRPRRSRPYPLVMSVHGGPVWQVRPTCLLRNALFLLLIKHGYALFLPNPRGSSGRGQSFIAKVLGDMGGADALDCLRGLDHLVARGIADPARLGVTGGSYGGFMSSWLITQESRFAAAVSVAPINNWITEHLLSNIPHWPKAFLADPMTCAEGQYLQRSPVMHAHKASTPTLTICGALDRTTPPQEGVQFHNALRENGVTSMLVTYPEEGHGIRKFPAVMDYTQRVIAWFMMHMPAAAQ